MQTLLEVVLFLYNRNDLRFFAAHCTGWEHNIAIIADLGASIVDKEFQ